MRGQPLSSQEAQIINSMILARPLHKEHAAVTGAYADVSVVQVWSSHQFKRIHQGASVNIMLAAQPGSAIGINNTAAGAASLSPMVVACAFSPPMPVLLAQDTISVLGNTTVPSLRADKLIVHAIVPESALFQHLVTRWHSERGASSSITQMAMSRSYQRIIGMGKETAVPLILQDLELRANDPDHWFWALQALTWNDPVEPEERGDMKQMARAWLTWGRTAGYRW